MPANRSLLLSFVAFCSLAISVASGGEIVGTYDCLGENAGGGNYQGTVEISKKGDAYQLEWTIQGQKHQGIAILTDGVLASSWIIKRAAPGGVVIQGGVVVYKVEENGKLSGKWVGHGGGKILAEVLTPQRRVAQNDRAAEEIR